MSKLKNLDDILYNTPTINPRLMKQQFLQGDKDAVYYYDMKEPRVSQYQAKFKGIQIEKGKAEIVNQYRTSCAGGTIPDPSMLSKIDCNCYF